MAVKIKTLAEQFKAEMLETQFGGLAKLCLNTASDTVHMLRRWGSEILGLITMVLDLSNATWGQDNVPITRTMLQSRPLATQARLQLVTKGAVVKQRFGFTKR